MDAVVWLDAPPVLRTAPAGVTVVDLAEKQSVRVVAARLGTRVRVPAGDRVLHSVFSPIESERQDLRVRPAGLVTEVPADRPGLSYIVCGADPSMATYVVVVDTPYHAVSDDTGRFTIADVPAGRYAYHAWRPGGEVISDHVSIEPNRAFEVRWP